jgi:hypothetical protein
MCTRIGGGGSGSGGMMGEQSKKLRGGFDFRRFWGAVQMGQQRRGTGGEKR